MTFYRTKNKKICKRYRFLSFARKQKTMDTELEKVVHKVGEFIGNKTADAVLSKTLAMPNKSNNDNIEKQEPGEG